MTDFPDFDADIALAESSLPKSEKLPEVELEPSRPGIKYYYDIEQGSDEWRKLKTGVITASNIKNIITPTLKAANNAKSKILAYELAAQRITNYVEPCYEGFDMMRGHIEEIYATTLYSENYDQLNTCGFIVNDLLKIGYSPDGVIGDRGSEKAGVEVKSRIQKYQIQSIANDEMPVDFMLQVQTGMLVTGWEYIDFISYSNGLPMLVKRISADKVAHEKITAAVDAFECKIVEIVNNYHKNSACLFETERMDYNMDGEIL